MTQDAIFVPFLGMMLLTILVWCYMYFRRFSWMATRSVDPQSLATTRQLLDIVPESVNTPAENLANLFELPVVFYAVCLYTYTIGQVDSLCLGLAWGFLVFRVCHSVIHCTYNRVMHRFFCYLVSSIMLWVFVIRAFVSAVR